MSLHLFLCFHVYSYKSIKHSFLKVHMDIFSFVLFKNVTQNKLNVSSLMYLDSIIIILMKFVSNNYELYMKKLFSIFLICQLLLNIYWISRKYYKVQIIQIIYNAQQKSQQNVEFKDIQIVKKQQNFDISAVVTFFIFEIFGTFYAHFSQVKCVIQPFCHCDQNT